MLYERSQVSREGPLEWWLSGRRRVQTAVLEVKSRNGSGASGKNSTLRSKGRMTARYRLSMRLVVASKMPSKFSICINSSLV